MKEKTADEIMEELGYEKQECDSGKDNGYDGGCTKECKSLKQYC